VTNSAVTWRGWPWAVSCDGRCRDGLSSVLCKVPWWSQKNL